MLTDVGPWYRALRKPRLQPPDWLFGPAWTVILAMAATAFVLAFEGAPDAAGRIRVALLFGLNAALHLLWTPLFFRARRPDWALWEVPFLWLSILAMMLALTPFSAALPWLLAPYLAWVGFAAWINLEIVRLNGPFPR